MKIRAIAPWFGGNRTLAESVGRELGKLRWCGVPFCGGCPELPYIDTAAGIASDLHHHLINLADVIRTPALKDLLVDDLKHRLFHQHELARAQERCSHRWQSCDRLGNVEWAADYFMSCWMGRGGHAGKRTEFTQGLALRWTSSGGDSAKRFQSAIESLDAWHAALHKWGFAVMDAFRFLAAVKDHPGHGLYVDAPWPGVGQEYAFNFSCDDHARLSEMLAGFGQARVVIRYGDHPLIRDLYPLSRWTWVEQVSRNQCNNAVREYLIINGPSYTAKECNHE